MCYYPSSSLFFNRLFRSNHTSLSLFSFLPPINTLSILIHLLLYAFQPQTFIFFISFSRSHFALCASTSHFILSPFLLFFLFSFFFLKNGQQPSNPNRCLYSRAHYWLQSPYGIGPRGHWVIAKSGNSSFFPWFNNTYLSWSSSHSFRSLKASIFLSMRPWSIYFG